MYPMDFEEFLWALGEKSMMELIKMQFGKCKPLGADMHRKAMSLFRQYMIVGGMPKAVDIYVKTHDLSRLMPSNEPSSTSIEMIYRSMLNQKKPR